MANAVVLVNLQFCLGTMVAERSPASQREQQARLSNIDSCSLILFIVSQPASLSISEESLIQPTDIRTLQ